MSAAPAGGCEPECSAGAATRERSFAEIAARILVALADPPKSGALTGATKGLAALRGAGDEDAERDEEGPPRPPSLETLVALARLASTFQAAPDALAAIETAAPILVIETGDSAFNGPLASVLRALLRERCALTSADALIRATTPYVSAPTAVMIEAEAAAKASEAPARDKQVAAAILSGALIVGVAASPLRDLPADLVRAADHRLNLAPLTAAGVAFVIENVTGASPRKALDARIAREATLPDLRLALRGRRGGDAAVDRLIDVIGARLAATDRTPRLEDLDGYGEAKAIGLSLGSQLADYAAGRISWSAVTRGLVLYGPPGTGKSTFARALAKTTGLPLVAGSLARWQGAREGHLGHLLGAMQACFAEAKRKAPCWPTAFTHLGAGRWVRRLRGG